MDDHRDDPEDWLAHAEFLRAIARRLSAPGEADDAVQDAVVAALAHGSPVANRRGWLGRVLGNAVRKRARSAARRRRREEGAARADAQPSAAEMAGAMEMQRRVADAVRALPEAYCTVVYLRYYRDRDARTIARDLGVPVETVRTRLKRAIALLRERLDRDGGRERWLALLAPLVRDPRALGGRVAAATVIGGVLMSSGKWAAAAAVAIAVGAWWFGSRAEVAPATAPAEPVAMAAAASAAGPGAASAPPRIPVAAPAPRPATILGRCVDPHGRALAGVTVTLRGRGGQGFADPDAQRSRADGGFAIEFAAPPNHTFLLRLTRPDLASAFGRWEDIAPGSRHDLGDVVLADGVAVAGQLVDAGGRAVTPVSAEPSLWLAATPRGQAERGIRPQTSARATVRADGAFALDDRLPPGRYEVRIDGMQPVDGEVTLALPVAELRVAVRRPDELPALRGVVVDTAGRPVAGARVWPDRREHGGAARTDREGRFQLPRRPSGDPDGPFAVVVDAAGHEPLVTPRTWSWGDEVRLIVRSGLDVEVAAVDARGGAPVRSFTARVVSMRSAPPRSPSARAHDSADGVARVSGVLRGRHLLVVEPESDALAAAARIVDVDGDGVRRHRVELWPTVAQAVRVVRTDGTPVTGSRVELIDPMGEEVTADSEPRDFGGLDAHAHNAGVLVDAAETGADGRATVRGAADRDYAVRCTGAHAPVVRSGVHLTGGPVEITVAAGGTLHVRVEPANAPAGLELSVRPAPGNATAASVPPPVAPGASGAATITGLAPGSWQVVAEARFVDVVATRPGVRVGSSNVFSVRREVAVRAGETTAVELDVTALLPAELRGTLIVEGKAYDGPVAVSRARADRGPTGEALHDVATATASDGHFVLTLPGGEWQVAVPMQIAGPRDWAYVPATPALRIAAGESAAATFHASVVRAAVVVVDAEGRPIEGVTLSFGTALPAACQVRPTDPTGRCEVVGGPGSHAVRALLPSPRGPSIKITLPDLALPAADASPIVLRLPLH